MRWASLFHHAFPHDALLHLWPRIRWPWTRNLWNSEPEQIFLCFKLFQLFAKLCLTKHYLNNNFTVFQRLCVPYLFYFRLLGLGLLNLRWTSSPLCVCYASLLRCTLSVLAQLSPPLCPSPCGFSINLSSFCYINCWFVHWSLPWGNESLHSGTCFSISVWHRTQARQLEFSQHISIERESGLVNHNFHLALSKKVTCGFYPQQSGD